MEQVEQPYVVAKVDPSDILLSPTRIRESTWSHRRWIEFRADESTFLNSGRPGVIQ
jgi:hypothetical protein